MPRASAAVTALGRSRYFYLGIAFIVLLLSPLWLQRPDDVWLLHEGQPLTYETVATPELREKGLSGRASLPADRGMLFVFDKSDKHCFWMKDMRFPIDMVWLDKDKRVVHIEQEVMPASYPDSFCPPLDARYVVEVNAGQTCGLMVGQRLKVQ